MSKPRLENWRVVQSDLLVGQVFDDPRFPDGEVIWTSRVVRLDRDTGKAYTKNTEYLLGAPYDKSKPSN